MPHITWDSIGIQPKNEPVRWAFKFEEPDTELSGVDEFIDQSFIAYAPVDISIENGQLFFDAGEDIDFWSSKIQLSQENVLSFELPFQLKSGHSIIITTHPDCRLTNMQQGVVLPSCYSRTEQSILGHFRLHTNRIFIQKGEPLFQLMPFFQVSFKTVEEVQHAQQPVQEEVQQEKVQEEPEKQFSLPFQRVPLHWW